MLHSVRVYCLSVTGSVFCKKVQIIFWDSVELYQVGHNQGIYFAPYNCPSHTVLSSLKRVYQEPFLRKRDPKLEI